MHTYLEACIALSLTTKPLESFGQSECDRVKKVEFYSIFEQIVSFVTLTLKAPRKTMHLNMSSAEVVCCK